MQIPPKTPIAIVSMSCRFPSAPDVQAFWKLLVEGIPTFSKIPSERWEKEDFPNTVQVGAFLDDVRGFDPAFFKISAEEARQMDPQQRICLELAYETMTNCGGVDRYKGSSTAVLLGVAQGTYGDLLTQEGLFEGKSDRFTTTGGLRNMIAARVSQAFDLRGASFVLDTACSSALAALHLAERMLGNNDCRQVLVGGVFLNITPSSFLGMQAAGALSANEETYRIFDARSDGFFMGEGAGFVMLKRLDDALADGDTVLALLSGIEMNNDGHSVSVMSPRPLAQRDVVSAVYERSALDKSKVVYIETHGTGTPVGDAVEIRSLSQVFDDGKNRYIGSAKANIGHLLSAAGIASLIKTILCLINRKILPHINCEQERENLQLSKNHWLIPHEIKALEQPEPLLMGINSFGFGGTNVHAVLEEYRAHRTQQQQFRQIIPSYQKVDCWLSPLKENQTDIALPPIYTQHFKPFVFAEKVLQNNDKSLFVTWDTPVELPKDAKSVKNEHILSELSDDVFLLFPSNWSSLHDWLLAHQHLFKPQKRLWILTYQAIQTAHFPFDWHQKNAEIAAFCKVIRDELPCTSTQIDCMDIAEASAICTSFGGQNLEETPFLIHRNGEWLQPFWEPFSPKIEREFPISSDDICLITGGLGGIGSAIAATLLKTKGVKIILNGRRQTPDATIWQNLLDISKKYQSEVHYFPADCSDEREIQCFTEGVLRQFGRLDFVFHAAGIVKPTAWTKLNQEHLEPFLKPKLDGLRYLDESVQKVGFEQTQWVLFSSISAVLPNASTGLGGYAIANGAMEQYAVWMKNQGRKVFCVAWGPWNGHGMSNLPVFQVKLAAYGIWGLSEQEGILSLSSLMQQPNMDSAMVLRHSGNQLPKRVFQEKKVVPIKEKTSQKTAVVLPLDVDLEAFLREILAEALEISPNEIEADTNLLNLGLDSLNAMDLAVQIEAKGFRNLPFELFFEHQTMQEIIAFLQKQQIPAAINLPQEETELPLSNLQKAFLKGHYLSQSPTFSFLRQTIDGQFQMQIFEQAVKQLFYRHPMLRAQVIRIRKENEIEFQQHFYAIEKAVNDWKIETISSDLSDEIAENTFVNRRFDLEKETPFRIGIQVQDEQTHIFLLMHHAFSDGWSLLLLAQEIWKSYERIIEGKNETPSTKDFAALWQRVAERKPDDPSVKWWQEQIKTYPNKTYSAKLTEKFRLNSPWLSEPSAVFPIVLPNEIVFALAEKAQKKGISLQALYFSTFHQSLCTWTNEPNMVLNCAVAGRHSEWGEEVFKSVGCFADAFPFYSSENEAFAWAKTFEKWYQKVAYMPGLDSPTVIKWIQEKQVQQPVAGFSFVKFPIHWAKNLQKIRIKSAGVRGYTFQTRFTLHCWEDLEGLKAALNYPQNLFNETELKRFNDCFLQALNAIAGMEKLPILALKSDKIKQPIFEKIRQQSRQHPLSIALKTASKTWTYKALMDASAKLAGGLLQRGFSSGNILAWRGGHSDETVIALLTAMRLGCTWLPIDKQLPKERVEWILKQAGANFLLTESDTEDGQNWSVPHLSFNEILQMEAAADINIEVPPEHFAYIIFTSGSSGQPKGVPISVAALDNYLSWCIEIFCYENTDRFLLTASIGFDASLRQLLAPLLVGAQLHIVSPHILRQPKLLLTALSAQRISVWSSVPSLWEVLIAALEVSKQPIRPPFRIVHVGGERLSADLVVRWQKIFGNKTVIFNLYGPTETTINASFFKIDKIWQPNEDIPIGNAAANAALWVMDEQGNETTEGELWVSGQSLTSGYLNGENDRFVWKNGQRFYKTGDWVKQRENGLLYFIGRTDRQIKWHGYRIEPEEIEHRILQIHGVKKAWVTLFENTLVGALVTDISTSTIEKKLQEDVPTYMIPKRWVSLSDFPLLANGKTDMQKLLKNIDSKMVQNMPKNGQSHEPLTSKEQKMSEIWSGILNQPILQKEAHFFNEGGDSLNAMLLFIDLEERGWRTMPTVEALYRHPTLTDFTRLFDTEPQQNGATDKYIQAKNTIKTPEYLPLTDAQSGFLMSARQTNGRQNLWRGLIPIKGTLDISCFRTAMTAVIERHIALRGKLEKRSGQYVFHVLPTEQTPVELYLNTPNWSSLQSATQAQLLSTFLEKTGADDFLHATDFPLLRSTLIQKSADDFIWHITVHHLLADGLSQQIFLRDFWAAYSNIAENKPPFLPPLSITVADYWSKTQLERTQSATSALDYWLSIWEKPFVQPQMEGNPEHIGFSFKSSVLPKKQLNEAANRVGVTPFSMVLYAYYRTLSEWFKQDDLVIGLAQHGRDVAISDVWNLFGNLTYAAPVRPQYPEDELKNLQNLAFQVRQTARFRLDIKALRKKLTYSIEPAQLLGSRFFITWLPETILPNLPNGISIELQETETTFSPSEQETAIMLTVKPNDSGEYVLRLAFNSRFFSDAEMTLFSNKLLEISKKMSYSFALKKTIQIQHQPFSIAETSRLDAALIAYLPSLRQVKKLLGTTDFVPNETFFKGLKHQIFGNQAFLWSEVQETDFGRTGVFLLPYWSEEITSDKGSELAKVIRQAADLAAAAGARSISLAGMLPAATVYGALLRPFFENSQLEITTGHTTTVVAVVKTLLRAIKHPPQYNETIRLSCVGLGSIGQAVLRTFLSIAPHPHSILLCDIEGKEAILRDFTAILRNEHQFLGSIKIHTGKDGLHERLLESNVIIGAASGGEIVDINRLSTGTILVDDSFPPCFNENEAIKRMHIKKDILVTGGGLLYMPNSTKTLYLPEGLAGFSDLLSGAILPETIASCQFESLLLARFPQLSAAFGLADYKQVLQYFEFMDDVEPAPFHIGGQFLDLF